VRPSVPHPGDTRHGWQWLAELAFRLGHETGVDSSTEALEALVAEVPFYAGLTHEEIGGTGVRWQDREQASAFPTPRSALGEGASGSPAERQTTSPAAPAETDHAPREEREAGGPEDHSQTLRLGTYRDLWAHEVTERSPALRFLMPGQTLELSLADAERFGVAQGDQVSVRSNGHSLKAKVAIRERIRPGSGFLIDGLAEQGPNALAGAVTVQVEKAGE
jgi:predicted molibdopterin-dependent oxidoreductase YjgC